MNLFSMEILLRKWQGVFEVDFGSSILVLDNKLGAQNEYCQKKKTFYNAISFFKYKTYIKSFSYNPKILQNVAKI